MLYTPFTGIAGAKEGSPGGTMPEGSNDKARRGVAGRTPMSAPHMAPRVHLTPKIAKIIEAIAYIVAEAARRKHVVTQYDVLKTLFLADKSHLNEYGRPITFDNYYAMKAGPVASVAFDLLKENVRTVRRFGIKNLPWCKSDPEPGSGRCYYSKAKLVHDEDILSPSDVQALNDALTTIKSLTFAQISKLTHADAAYTEAWRDDSQSKRFFMSLGMLFDSPNFEAAETVRFLSKQ